MGLFLLNHSFIFYEQWTYIYDSLYFKQQFVTFLQQHQNIESHLKNVWIQLECMEF